MPALSIMLPLIAALGDSLPHPRIRYEEAQLRAEVDSAPPSIHACPRGVFPRRGWRELAPGAEGIRYWLPAVVKPPAPYAGKSYVLGATAPRGWRFAAFRSNTWKPDGGGFPVEWHPTRHDYSWCREVVGRRPMLITAYKLTWLRNGRQPVRSYVVYATWELRPGWWLAISGEAPTPALQRELLAIIRTFRVDLTAAAYEPRFPEHWGVDYRR